MADIEVLNGLGLKQNNPISLETLEIHKLTQAQYDTLLSNGMVNANAIYMTPNETFDISTLATVEQLNEKADKKHPHSFDDIKQKTDGENSETLSTVLDTMNLAIGGKIDKGNNLAHYGIEDAVSQGDFEQAFNVHETNHAEANAQVNVIESIKVNDTPLTVTGKTVNISVPTGSLADKSEVAEGDLDTTLADKINGKADKATNLAGYGITDAVSLEDFNAHTTTNHAEAGAQVNKIENILVNGTALTPDADKTVNISVPTDYLVQNDIKNFVTKDAVYTKEEIDTMLAEVAFITTEANEDIQITHEINQQIIAAVNAALTDEIIDDVLARIPNGNEVAY